jgi:glutathione S-transferase
MITFYGSPMSSAVRTHWMLEEVGVPYDYRRLSVRAGDTKKPEFLAINPGGKIPCIQDGNLVLTESMAINLYLAERYGKDLMPGDVAGRARVYEWSFWAISNVQPLLLTMFQNTMLLPEAERNPRAVETARQQLGPYLAFLDSTLAKTAYLLGDRFTAADLNTASVVGIGTMVGLDLGPYAKVQAWLGQVQARPAFAKSMD